MQPSKRAVIAELHRIGAIKQGEFTLKSGDILSTYIDLRSVISYPKLFRQITELLWELVSSDSEFICGVPYSALTFATAISALYEKPMLLRRKEAKNYGTKKLIEGAYQVGQSCLVIEDVVVTGDSIIETITDLETEGLHVKHVIAIVDRESGARESLANKGYIFSSIFTLNELLA